MPANASAGVARPQGKKIAPYDLDSAPCRLSGKGGKLGYATMKLSIRALIWIMTVGCAACGGTGEYRKTGGTYAPRGPDCDYRVVRNRIVEPYEELGVIDIDAFSMQQLPDDEERFRKLVGPTVCAQGGHAVIPTLDVYGHWVHGTIIRFNPAECDRCRTEGIMTETEAILVEEG